MKSSNSHRMIVLVWNCLTKLIEFPATRLWVQHRVLQRATQIIVQLSKFIMTELWMILGKQYQDYCISDIYQPQYPVENKATNIDGTPVTNTVIERVWGLVAYHLLECVSRSMIFYEEALLEEQNGCERSITIEQFHASLKKTIVS